MNTQNEKRDQITDKQGLEALPDLSIIRSNEGDAWQKFNISGWAVCGGMPDRFNIDDIALPATILYTK